MLGHLRAAASVLRRGHTDLETIVDKDNKVAPILCVFLIIFYSDHFGHRVLFNTKSSFQVITQNIFMVNMDILSIFFAKSYIDLY